MQSKSTVFAFQVFEELSKREIAYCVLRNIDEIQNGNVHDIDMVLDFNKYQEAILVLFKLGINAGWKTHLFAEKDNGNLITIHMYTIEYDNPVLIHFDLFRSFSWKGLQLLDYKTLLQGRQKNQGIYEASAPVQAVTMLFSKYLYHGYIKKKYRKYIHEIFFLNENETKKLMSNFLNSNFCEDIYRNVINECWEIIEQKWEISKKHIYKQFDKKKIINNFKLELFYLKRMLNHTGIYVLFQNNMKVEDEKIFAREIQKLLSQTFSSDEIIMLFLNGRYKIFTGIQTFIELSRGKIIFSNKRNILLSRKDFIKVTNDEKAGEVACHILEQMSKRYLR